MLRSVACALSLLAVALSPALGQHAAPAFQARAFADLNYLDTQRPMAEGFRLGQVVGHFIANLSDRVTVFAEVSATPGSSGFSVEAERLMLRYDHSDLLKLSAGRYHTPLSYWNTAFHHGTWLQSTISRPDMVRVGSGFFPLHFVGVLAEGTVAAEPFGFRYGLGAGNGRGTSIARAGDAGDANSNRAVVGSAALSLPQRTGFVLGASYYIDRISPTSTLSVDERILSAHLAREREPLEILLEYGRVAHKSRRQPNEVTHSDAAYAQVGYRAPAPLQAFKPYVRFERTRVPPSDSIFAPLNLNYRAVLGGVRYDLATTAALKFEYRNERLDSARRFRTIALQLTFTFPSRGTGSDESAPSPDATAHHASRQTRY